MNMSLVRSYLASQMNLQGGEEAAVWVYLSMSKWRSIES